MNAVRGSSNATDDAGVRLLEAVRALQSRLREAAAETEANRRLAPPLIGALTEVGLFRMLVPRSLGGGEVDPATALWVIEEAGSADGAAGWCVMIGATSALLAAYLPEMVAASIYAAPEVVTGGALAPTGRALVTDGGYHASGRWAFGSGIEHCAWRIGACVVFEDGAPRMLADGVPDVRIVLVSAAESDVI